MILRLALGAWMAELLVVNGLLCGFSLPNPGQKEPRLYGLNVGPLCLLVYRRP